MHASLISLLVLMASPAAHAALGGGFDPASATSAEEDPVVELNCVDLPDAGLWFDGACRDFDWIQSTLASGTGRTLEKVYGAADMNAGVTNLVLVERGVFDPSRLHYTVVSPDAVPKLTGPNRGGYAITAEQRVTTWVDAFGDVNQRTTTFGVHWESIDTFLMGPVDMWEWVVHADETYVQYSGYHAEDGDGTADALCAAEADLESITFLLQCKANYDGVSWYETLFTGLIGGGLTTAGTALGGLTGMVTVGALVAPPGAPVTGPAIAGGWAGTVAFFGGAAYVFDSYDDLNTERCIDLSNSVRATVLLECLREEEEEDAPPETDPDVPSDTEPPEVDEGELGCPSMQIPRSVSTTDTHCDCVTAPDDVAEVEVPCEDSFDETCTEIHVMDGATTMECSDSTTTTWECCDPGVQDCGPGEVDGYSNASELSCN